PSLIPATPEPTLTPDPFRDWKAYGNRAAELSFKYPGNLSLKEEIINGTAFVITLESDASPSATVIKIISSQKTQAELVNTYVGGGTAVPTDKESDVEISGITGKQGDYVFPGSGEGLPLHYADITRDTTSFLFINFDNSQKSIFDLLL